jgi:hypothetical protein
VKKIHTFETGEMHSQAEVLGDPEGKMRVSVATEIESTKAI